MAVVCSSMFGILMRDEDAMMGIRVVRGDDVDEKPSAERSQEGHPPRSCVSEAFFVAPPSLHRVLGTSWLRIFLVPEGPSNYITSEVIHWEINSIHVLRMKL